MSTVRLKKDVPGRGKEGEVISVPFGVRAQMLQQGVAEDLPQAPAAATAKPKPTAGDSHKEEIARLNAFHAEAIQRVKDEAVAQMKKQEQEHEAELEKLEADLASAKKTITELQAKLSKK